MFGYSQISKFCHRIEITEYNPSSKADDGTQEIKFTGKPVVYCYSLTNTQKFIGISLVVLALIAVAAGAYSLSGANFIGNQAAWAMVGAGAGVAVVTVGGMTINHLKFVKAVGNYLAGELNWDCGDGTQYADEKSAEVIKFSVNKAKYYLKPHSKQTSQTSKTYRIDFYRTNPSPKAPTNP